MTLWGDRSWAAPINYGSAEGIYIEDSSFTSTSTSGIGGATDCFSGGRLVFRHNTVSMLNVQSHGAVDPRSTPPRLPVDGSLQQYLHLLEYQPSWPSLRGFAAARESSTTTPSRRRATLTRSFRRSTAGMRAQGAEAAPAIRRGGRATGTSAYDQNSSAGYRCVDQPGSGTSALLGPDLSGSVTPSNTGVGNALDPNLCLGQHAEWFIE